MQHQMNTPHIFPPLPREDDDRSIYSVNVDLPPELDDEIKRYVDADEMTSPTLIIHEALYYARAEIWSHEALQNELREKIEHGLRDIEAGNTIDVTPEFWNQLRERSTRSIKTIRELQAQGQVGNLLLPEELYEFVVERIASGAYETPSALVHAAIPLLRRKPPFSTSDS